ncbi:uncharacterized protein LOC113234555 isoform X2 [Hyposmocoma kahamanoa]|uniref:uncharacterized protein LOC113234555 isoform X2 n=1 Tax=Hyposmocoma kahamanoa TaxID=1477025 RepID=UPI000E6D93AF|nr:uncharacterized protein LOC113234555 isoform X2 [Hyposmocoma kahamanoa]
MLVILILYIQIHLTVAGSIYTATTTKKPSDEQDYTRQSHTKYPLLINIQAFRTSSGRQRKIAPMLKVPQNHDIFLDISDSFVQRLKESLTQGLSDSVKNRYNTSREKDIRAKLYKMTVEEKKRAEQKVQLINKLLSLYKHKLSLKLDFIAHYFNVNFMKLSQRYDETKKNVSNYNLLQVLSLYTELHTSNQFLSEFLTLLPSAMKLDPPDVRDFRPPSKKEGISWSYYDDSMSFAINR